MRELEQNVLEKELSQKKKELLLKEKLLNG